MTSLYNTLGLHKDNTMSEASKRIDYLKSFLNNSEIRYFLEKKIDPRCSQLQQKEFVESFTVRAESFLSISRRILTTPTTRWLLDKICQPTMNKKERQMILDMIRWHNEVSTEEDKLRLERLVNKVQMVKRSRSASIDLRVDAEQQIPFLCTHCVKSMTDGEERLKLIACKCERTVVHDSCAVLYVKQCNGICANCTTPISVNVVHSYQQLFRTDVK